ncbi:MAG TPA: hypothetical protein VN671_07830, partial [Solirubrobacterales bacterium]|nr:hypothetical protein [Solirubrobacterales bacterium]
SLLSDLRPDAILSAVGSLAPLVLGAFAAASALAIQRLVSTNRTLRSRRTLAVVPADDFDPKPDAVLRFAAELGATDRSVLGWIDRRASAVRVTLTGDAEGRLVYLVSVPERSFRFLQGALGAYDGVELREPGELLGKRPVVDDLATHRTELVLARSGLEPLARLSLDPDPLRPFATALESISPEAGEELSVCIDLLPATGWRRTRLRKRLQRLARRRHGERRSLREVLDGPQRGRGRPAPDQLLERRLINEALDAKLRDSGSLFEVQALVRCRARNRAGAKGAMHRVLGAFEPFAAQNWFRARGLPVPGLGFLGSDLPLRRGSFDRRMDTGLFRPGRRAIVTASEMAGFLKPPNMHCNADNVVRAGTLLGAPPKLPAFEEGKADLIPLGRVGANGNGQIVGVRTADTFFSYIAGRSRFGKTETALGQFVHLARSGQGCFLLDPHHDGIERVKPYLTEEGVRERVVEIDLTDTRRQPAWNLLSAAGRSPARAAGQVDAVVDAFASVLRWDELNTRALNLTTQSVQALVDLSRALPAQLAPTIFEIPVLLSDDGWRAAVLPYVSPPVRHFFEDRFPLLPPEAITPVTNLVDRLGASPVAAALLGNPLSGYDVRAAMDRGLIVLFCSGWGSTRDRLIANLAAFDALHAAHSRRELTVDRRRAFSMWFDEAQIYDGGSSGTLTALHEQIA